eukprot:TRINITY_DN6040_c0_g1_i1.p3 TRINITY_DN6040_c0_g1~~TRINITY_DN6040_c0_g1_i1.p3  ORF type:complete len:101 (+),score=34.16 TRINITY_DN6040_c0_g1_i1:56-358(+)
MMRRSMVRLSQAARPGHQDATALDWIQTFVNPFYHFERLTYIEEEVDSTKQRKWILAGALIAYPTYWLLVDCWAGLRNPGADKEGNRPQVHWNDEQAGQK